jgi:hypothetical protein
MGPNDANIIRVYPRQVGSPASDSAFSYNAPLEVVMEVEAGSALFGSGAQYAVGIVVRDLSDFSILPKPAPTPGTHTPVIDANDNLHGANWDRQADQFVYTVPAASLAGRQNHILEILGYLRVNVVNPDMSFTKSEPFIITQQ